MDTAAHLEYRRAPWAPVYMARAMLTPRRSGLRSQAPALVAQWRDHLVDGAPLADFLALTGLAGHPSWPLLYPHTVGFRLQMAMLTDRRFPLPIWNALQIRNHLVLHRIFQRGARLDFEVRPTAQRVLDRGAEIDLRCTAHEGRHLAWEATNTFYYRGRFGVAGEASPHASAPSVGPSVQACWTMPNKGAIRCGKLTGDYNGIHLSDWYARRFGFPSAFQHPQRVLAQCLAQVPDWNGQMPLRLDAWLKGPVYYGADVALRMDAGDDGTKFSLHVNGDERPAIVGRLSTAARPDFR